MPMTPGPWTAKYCEVRAGDRLVALVYSEDGEKHRWYFECGRANARAIAALPQLLEAAKWALRGLQQIEKEVAEVRGVKPEDVENTFTKALKNAVAAAQPKEGS